MTEAEVVIIGSGPAGLTAGIYLSRAMIQPLLLTGIHTGGQLMYTRDLENFPGFPDGKPGPEFMMNTQKQAVKFGTTIEHQQVTAVDFSQRPFRLWTNFPQGMQPDEFNDIRGEALIQALTTVKQEAEPSHSAQAILISTGANSLKLGIPGETSFLGRGVSICAVCDAAFYKDKRAIVIGGGDSALEDALALTKFTDQVTIVHRRDSFRASKIMQERVLNHPHVKVLWNTEAQEIKGEQGQVTALVVKSPQGEQTLETDGVFIAIGYHPNTAVFSQELTLDSKGYLLTAHHFSEAGLALAKKLLDKDGLISYPTMTSVAGVFGAGDVTDHKYRQAIVAAGSGAMAALDIERWLNHQSKA